MILERSSCSLPLPPPFCPQLSGRRETQGGVAYLLSRGGSGPVTLVRLSCLLLHDVFASDHLKTRSFTSLLTLKAPVSRVTLVCAHTCMYSCLCVLVCSWFLTSQFLISLLYPRTLCTKGCLASSRVRGPQDATGDKESFAQWS